MAARRVVLGLGRPGVSGPEPSGGGRVVTARHEGPRPPAPAATIARDRRSPRRVRQQQWQSIWGMARLAWTVRLRWFWAPQPATAGSPPSAPGGLARGGARPASTRDAW